MKTDFVKTLDRYRAQAGTFRIIEVPPQRYLMIDGHGDPNTSAAYADAVATLYPVAYALKFASKDGLDRDYVVPPLEALWWAESMAAFTSSRDTSAWDWTAMILVPDWITDDLVDAARAKAARKAPALDLLRVEELDEGTCVQTLHLGPYDDEAATLERMHDTFIPESGLRMTGKHHEVYLSDARRVAPEKLRTLLRQPVLRG
ncbi:GyrI-like domain-containing protein [Leifsonia sp. ZF2019]|uniref:GyrI-like domain-containing protein n=1 Tax=Leifsonia sp. ZF2019 TaxID=2781978 RepID=UPI001CBE8908|nr:GyrI-like domain-containing protein [Leifsonia sp. ZF2019]UAJ78485.1 GyrI-like domain-containing protein [Leifsonia sp. ZF2019]